MTPEASAPFPAELRQARRIAEEAAADWVGDAQPVACVCAETSGRNCPVHADDEWAGDPGDVEPWATRDDLPFGTETEPAS
jgi:hypothetical protein